MQLGPVGLCGLVARVADAEIVVSFDHFYLLGAVIISVFRPKFPVFPVFFLVFNFS